MVKTKVVAKKLTGLAALKRPPMADVHTEVKPHKKGDYRTKDEPYDIGEDEPKAKPKSAWEAMLDGQTYRTTDVEKAHIALDRSLKEGLGINIQGFAEHSDYVFYMTRILTQSESKKPSDKVPVKKGKKK